MLSGVIEYCVNIIDLSELSFYFPQYNSPIAVNGSIILMFVFKFILKFSDMLYYRYSKFLLFLFTSALVPFLNDQHVRSGYWLTSLESSIENAGNVYRML